MTDWHAESPRTSDAPKRSARLDDIVARKDKKITDLRRFPQLARKAVQLVWLAAPEQFRLTVVLQFLGGVIMGGQLYIGKLLIEQFVDVEVTPTLAEVLPEITLLFTLLLVGWLISLTRTEQQRLLCELVERHTTQEVMRVATTVPLLNFDQPEFYDQLQRARINATVRPVEIVRGLLNILQGGFAVLVVGGVLLWVEPVVFVVMCLGYVPTWVLNRSSSRLLYRHNLKHTPGDRRRNYLYMVATRKDEAHEVRAFGTSEFLQSEYGAIYDQRIADLRSVIKKRLVLGLMGGTISVFVSAIAVVWVVHHITSGQLDMASAVVALGALILAAGRLRSFTNGISTLYEASLFLEDFTRFLDAFGPDQETEQNTAGKSARASRRSTELQSIKLQNVCFQYPARDVQSLTDVSLELRRGEVIALVGENGSGKTTLAKVMAGLYKPTSGMVLWNEEDLSTKDPEWVLDQVAVIFQDFARYFLSAHENIAIGNTRRVEDLESVQNAARAAGVHDFVSTLPDSYETILGPEFIGGSDLSGGQWQRIALARAYFRDAPLLILDEPTAALDPRGEYEVFQRVRSLARGRTVVLITHRFSSAKSADRILVLQGGRVMEEGSHDVLMARKGIYEELYTLQSKSYGEAIHG